MGKIILGEDLENDLRRVQALFGEKTFSKKDYMSTGKYSWVTVSDHFGSWNKALEKTFGVIKQTRGFSSLVLCWTCHREYLQPISRQGLRVNCPECRAKKATPRFSKYHYHDIQRTRSYKHKLSVKIGTLVKAEMKKIATSLTESIVQKIMDEKY